MTNIVPLGPPLHAVVAMRQLIADVARAAEAEAEAEAEAARRVYVAAEERARVARRASHLASLEAAVYAAGLRLATGETK